MINKEIEWTWYIILIWNKDKNVTYELLSCLHCIINLKFIPIP